MLHIRHTSFLLSPQYAMVSFTDFPYEIRREIHFYALAQDTRLDTHTDTSIDDARQFFGLNLLKTSASNAIIAAEAQEVLFSSNHFGLYDTDVLDIFGRNCPFYAPKAAFTDLTIMLKTPSLLLAPADMQSELRHYTNLKRIQFTVSTETMKFADSQALLVYSNLLNLVKPFVRLLGSQCLVSGTICITATESTHLEQFGYHGDRVHFLEDLRRRIDYWAEQSHEERPGSYYTNGLLTVRYPPWHDIVGTAPAAPSRPNRWRRMFERLVF